MEIIILVNTVDDTRKLVDWNASGYGDGCEF